MSESKTFILPDGGQSGSMMPLLASLCQKQGVDPNVLLAMRGGNGWGGNGIDIIVLLFLFMLFNNNGFGFGNQNGNLPNLINNDAGRVRMANLAQIINVLQAIIFTDGDKMLLTPTYHIFDMYKVHQDATLLPSTTTCSKIENGKFKADQVSASASKDKDGVIHVSLANLDLN